MMEQTLLVHKRGLESERDDLVPPRAGGPGPGRSAPRSPRDAVAVHREQRRRASKRRVPGWNRLKKRVAAPMTRRKSPAELERNGTALARDVTNLKHLAASMMKRAQTLERRSELLLRRAEQTKKRMKRK